MSIRALTGDDALALAKQTAGGTIHLVAVEYNWGAPVSGRYDTDFFNIWAAVSANVGMGTLFLQGRAANGEWSINTPFERTGSFTTPSGAAFGFFSLALQSQTMFPTEFVLRFASGNGETRYDNNQGTNYHIEPFRGWGVSAVRKDEAIFALGGIAACQLLRAKYPPASVA
jgi:hypothetical protein